jgi:16S rRNA (adenine1518-N6/adenine1519-N6)-dimethyltransferase
VEVDPRFEIVLREVLHDVGNAEIIIGDFLELDLPALLAARHEGSWTVVGNVPYYITSPVISKIVGARSSVSRALLMVQREVARRLLAEPGSNEYGAFTVFAQYYCEMRGAMKVSRNVFYPAPEVDSELVEFRVRERPAAQVRDEDLFFRIVRAAFGKRRKTLVNALSSSDNLGWDRSRAGIAIAAAGIDSGRRGETLSIEEFAAIANQAG